MHERELSIFIDESGIQEGTSRYYLVTLVLHDQSQRIDSHVDAYQTSLRMRGLPDIPFHSTPLLRGHDAYASLDMGNRKRLLVSFGTFVRTLPIRYRAFAYRSSEFSTAQRLRALLKRDLTLFLFDHLELFQAFDRVKIYYDNGQPAVTEALHSAVSYVLSKNVTVYRTSSYGSFRLAQAADYLCEIELAALKYGCHEETETDVKFFGGIGSFKKNWLKQARRKALT